MTTEGGVLAIVETDLGGEPTAASLETLGAARVLAEGLGCGLAAAILAGQGDSAARPIAGRGAGRIYELRCHGDTSPGAEAVRSAIEAAHPIAVLIPDSPTGRAVACTTAAHLGWELVSNCALVKVRNGTVELGRPCLSGRAFAQIEWDRSSAIIMTITPGAFPVPSVMPGEDTEAEVIVLDAPAPAPAPGVTVLSEVAPLPEAMRVTDASVLVAGGAGVGGPEGFGLLLELAGKLGGTVAASRVAVDRGWMPSERQVGLTGKSVAPHVYLAFGISGAPQHIAGIRSAGKVVAINKDPRAPIFDVADLAVVADLHALVPALLERLEMSHNMANGKGE